MRAPVRRTGVRRFTDNQTRCSRRPLIGLTAFHDVAEASQTALTSSPPRCDDVAPAATEVRRRLPYGRRQEPERADRSLKPRAVSRGVPARGGLRPLSAETSTSCPAACPTGRRAARHLPHDGRARPLGGRRLSGQQSRRRGTQADGRGRAVRFVRSPAPLRLPLSQRPHGAASFYVRTAPHSGVQVARAPERPEPSPGRCCGAPAASTLNHQRKEVHRDPPNIGKPARVRRHVSPAPSGLARRDPSGAPRLRSWGVPVALSASRNGAKYA